MVRSLTALLGIPGIIPGDGGLWCTSAALYHDHHQPSPQWAAINLLRVLKIQNLFHLFHLGCFIFCACDCCMVSWIFARRLVLDVELGYYEIIARVALISGEDTQG
jgi:hypothetical protein